MNNTSIVWVSNRTISPQSTVIWQKICQEYPTNNIRFSRVQELLSVMPSLEFNVDCLGIDLDDFAAGVYPISVTEMISAIKTIASLCPKLDQNGIIVNRSISIIAVVGASTPSELIQEFLDIPGVSGILPRGDDFSYVQVKHAFVDILEHKSHVPECIAKKLHLPLTHKNNLETSTPLTPRQQQILTLIMTRGASNKAIANILNISESTVKLHVGGIFRRFGVRSRTQLAVFLNKKT